MGLQVLQQLPVVELPIPAVDLRDFSLKVSQIALRETAHDEELLYSPFGLGLCKLEDGIDALLFGIGNEAAGIDDNDFTLGVVAIVRTLIAISLHQPHKHLAVNEILRATERNKINRLQNLKPLLQEVQTCSKSTIRQAYTKTFNKYFLLHTHLILKQRVHELTLVKQLQVFHTLAQANILHGYLQLV